MPESKVLDRRNAVPSIQIKRPAGIQIGKLLIYFAFERQLSAWQEQSKLS